MIEKEEPTSYKEVKIYKTLQGKQPFTEWLDSIRDKEITSRIYNRIKRLVAGHYGDCKAIGDKVLELRIHNNGGCRIYFTEIENTIVLLLLGGDKNSQTKDIEKAKQYCQDFWSRYE